MNITEFPPCHYKMQNTLNIFPFLLLFIIGRIIELDNIAYVILEESGLLIRHRQTHPHHNLVFRPPNAINKFTNALQTYSMRPESNHQ